MQGPPEQHDQVTPGQAAYPIPSHLWHTEPSTPPPPRSSAPPPGPQSQMWHSRASQQAHTPSHHLGMPSPLLLPGGLTPGTLEQGRGDRMMSSLGLGTGLGLPVQLPLWLDPAPHSSTTRLGPSSPAMPKPHLHTILQGLRRCVL